MDHNLDDALDDFRVDVERNVRVVPPHKIAERGARRQRPERIRDGVTVCAVLTFVAALLFLLW